MPSSARVAIIVSLFAAAFAKKTWKDVDTLQVGVKVRHLLNSSSLHNVSLQLDLYEEYCKQHVLILCLLPILSQSDLQSKPEECIRKTRPSDEVEVHYTVNSSSHQPPWYQEFPAMAGRCSILMSKFRTAYLLWLLIIPDGVWYRVG